MTCAVERPREEEHQGRGGEIEARDTKQDALSPCPVTPLVGACMVLMANKVKTNGLTCSGTVLTGGDT